MRPDEKTSTKRPQLNPILIMLAILAGAVVLTHIVPAGRYDRYGGKVAANTYHAVPKVTGVSALLAPAAPKMTDDPARAAGVVAFFSAIPDGMTKSANTIFMVMFVGGMFGILRATGAIDAALERLLHVTTGNVGLLTAGVMLILACGATFLGLVSEYLALLPLLMSLGRRLNLPKIFAPAIVAVGGWVGYAASVTNPVVLAVAQPLAGVPVFSGMLPRLIIFTAMFSASLAYILLYLRRSPTAVFVAEPCQFTARHICVLLAVVLCGIALVAGTGMWRWETAEHAAAFVAFAVVLAVVGGLKPSVAADAFLEGMVGLLMPAAMIGLAAAIGNVLQSSQILDTIVQALGRLVGGHSSGSVAGAFLFSEMAFDVLLQSTTAKAAVSLPILVPIAQLSGVSGQVSVAALTLGSGLTNLITPTNGVLLAILSLSDVSYREWARFIVPLFAILTAIAFAALYILAALGG